ncbi:uncharacterized protein LOC100376678 [Saccoglossus kowalevskii]|uniref:Zinc finger protein 724-like n=1 Tax=Saccoglossus kowalevskii TaxID=10224 RepID=A0ABM0GTQ8_SACKO|nr:PREDICTED: putative zinc finger protein 724-like [Saccoglossus kowalevskii]
MSGNEEQEPTAQQEHEHLVSGDAVVIVAEGCAATVCLEPDGQNHQQEHVHVEREHSSESTVDLMHTVPAIIEATETEANGTATVTVQYHVTSTNPCTITRTHETPLTQTAEVASRTEIPQDIGAVVDVLICGQCHQQYIDIVEFLNHKAEHQTPGGNHRCELCKKTFSTGLVVVEHYQCKHKVAFPRENSNVNNSNFQSTNHTNLQPVVLHNSSRKKNHDEKKDKPASDESDAHREDNDFKFLLITEKVKGAKFEYGKTAFKCLFCNHKTQTKNVLVKHVTNKHADVMGQEPEVPVVLNNDTCKEQVMLLSEYNKMNQCSLKNPLEHGRSARKHRAKKYKKDDPWGIYPCEFCEKVFNRARSLRVHLETHRTEKNFLCDECGKAFKSQTRLRVHRRVHRNKIFKCIQCDFQSNINAAIHAHRQMHTQGSVLCDICGYAYTDKSTLHKHMRVHSRDRPYGCTFEGCTWRFKTEAMYKAHIRAHTSDGKFKCSFCGYLFRHKHHLQRHETNMHGVKITKSVRVQKEEKVAIELADATTVTVGPQIQHIVVDGAGNAISYEQADFATLNYQTLIQTPETRQILQAAQEQENPTVFS